MQKVLQLFKETFSEWSEDKAPRLAAALSYYTIFSLAPLLIVVLGIASILYSGAEEELLTQIQNLVGEDGAAAIEAMLGGQNSQSSGIIATIVGVATLLFGASGVFGQLQDSLNTIWNVQPKPDQGIMAIVKKRFFSLTMVLGTGFLLLVSLIASTTLNIAINYLSDFLPDIPFLLQAINGSVALLIVIGTFGLIYKIVPDVEIAWKDVWVGAAVTGLLFLFGQWLLQQYITYGAPASKYGAVGSLIIILIWLYYSAQIFFFGAEFTQVYARLYGSRIQPSSHAMRFSRAMDETQEQQKASNDADTDKPVPQRAPQTVRTSDDPTPGTPQPRGPVVTMVIGFVGGLFIGLWGSTKSKEPK